jgi:predicted DNA-binding transcriptional regulator YafY
MMDILNHTGEVEVISPKALRDAVSQRLKDALGHYR